MIATLTLHLQINDKQALYRAALAQMEKDGINKKDANKSLRPGGAIDVGNCLRMLLDPGVSPDGCQILDSTAEVFE